MEAPEQIVSDEDQEILKSIHKISGFNYKNYSSGFSIVTEIRSWMDSLGFQHYADFLAMMSKDTELYQKFISKITIHTTSWFREMPHFQALEHHLKEYPIEPKKLKILSLGCSTGEEAYSIAILFEHLKQTMPYLDYEILGLDIDSLSIEKAQKAIYRTDQLKMIPKRYHHSLLVGKKRLEGLFTLDKEVRKKCSFQVFNILHLKNLNQNFDLIFCRNVLIYFDECLRKDVVYKLAEQLDPKGMLFLGHADQFRDDEMPLDPQGHATYTPTKRKAIKKDPSKPRILLIDDDGGIVNILVELLEEKGFEVETLKSTRNATEVIKKQDIDLILTDNFMPDEKGMEWLRRFRLLGNTTPAVVISGAFNNEILRALEHDAQDCIDKVILTSKIDEYAEIFLGLIKAYRKNQKLPTYGESRRSPIRVIPKVSRPDVILIGASTGGPEALMKLLKDIGPDAPPILVTQHISTDYLAPFGKRLADNAGMGVGASHRGAPIERGHIYIAHGDYHLGVDERDDGLFVKKSNAGPISGHRPSVDFLFQSATRFKKHKVLAVLLTGMGSDGAKGLLELKKSGAFTACQDELSSIVYGMPKAAVELNAAMFVGDITQLRQTMQNAIRLKKAG